MKRKISICSGRFQRFYGPMRALELAKEAGADAVDFTLCGYYDCRKPDNLYAKGESAVIEHFCELREHAEAIGIEFAQTHGRIHGLCPDSDVNEAHYADGHLDCIATRILGAKHCVMHTVSESRYPNASPEEMRRLNREMFVRLLPSAVENNIKIATETFGNYGKNYEFMNFFADIDEFVAAYEDVVAADPVFRNHFCYCVDTGHTNMATHRGQPSAADYTRRLGSAVEVLHINDNEGLTDMHAIPMPDAHSLTGCVDWWDFMRALDEIGYNGYYNLELGFNNYTHALGMEETIFSIKVMKYILQKHYGEPQSGFIDETSFLPEKYR